MSCGRRQFLQGCIGSALLGLPASAAWTRTRLGTADISTLSDGYLTVPEPTVLGAANATALTERPCNITLLRDGARTIVFDVGAGPNFMPSAGQLGESLSQAGIALEDVTDVLFTHAHPDHFWGVLDDFDEPVFPEARYLINRDERDFWTHPDTLAKLPENRQVFASAANRLSAALGDRLETFQPGDEVAPGIEALATPGHTPGHCSFVIHRGSESAIVLGDVVVDEAVSFSQPERPLQGDFDPAGAAATRMTVLDRLAAERTLLSGFHLTRGGLGYAEKDSTGRFHFQPV